MSELKIFYSELFDLINVKVLSFIFEQPKSLNLIFPLESTKILAPLTSLCIICNSCKYFKASNIYLE